MPGCERYEDVGVLRANRRRIAVGKIDSAVGQADVVDDAGKLPGRDVLPNFVFDAVAQRCCFFNASAGWSANMQREFAAVYSREKVLAQKGQKDERSQTCQKETRHKNAAMVDEHFQQ